MIHYKINVIIIARKPYLDKGRIYYTYDVYTISISFLVGLLKAKSFLISYTHSTHITLPPYSTHNVISVPLHF